MNHGRPSSRRISAVQKNGTNFVSPSKANQIKLLGVGKLEEDVGIGGEDVVVDLALDLGGLRAEVELLEVDLALAELLVAADVVVHDLDLELHVVDGGDVEVEVLAVDGVLLVLLLGRGHLAEVLVEEGVVLLQLELENASRWHQNQNKEGVVSVNCQEYNAIKCKQTSMTYAL